MRVAVIAAFLIIPIFLLVFYMLVFHFFGILRKKARTEKEIICVERLLSPMRNPLPPGKDEKRSQHDPFEQFRSDYCRSVAGAVNDTLMNLDKTSILKAVKNIHC